MSQGTFKNILRLVRPEQSVKNVFVFAALFFGGKIWDSSALFHTFIGFVAFCLCSSGVYCMNDIFDRRRDRMHIERRTRPVASGAVSVGAASLVAILLSAAGIILSAAVLPETALYIAVLYLLLNIGYSAGLKSVPLLDIVIIAAGFLLRVAMGGICGGVTLTPWIIALTFMLTFFVALAKRDAEAGILESACNNGGVVYASIKGSVRPLGKQMLDVLTVFAGAIVIIVYAFYSLRPETICRYGSCSVIITAIPVCFGISYYTYLTLSSTETYDPTRVFLRDSLLKSAVILWLLIFVSIIYF